jgi:hypothetical protein
LIVTADCDFARRKHRELISYVPVLRLCDYARMFVISDLMVSALRNRYENAVAHIRELQAKLLPEFPSPLSDDGTRAWIDRDPPDVIVDTLGAAGTPRGDKLHAVLDEIRRVRTASQSPSMKEQLAALDSLKTAKERRAGQQALEKLACLPGDCFFLGTLGNGSGEGFIAYLRLVREIRSGEIAIRATDLRDGEVKAKRIARTRSPYIYRLTQQLGDVFASVALPADYELARDEIMRTGLLGTTKEPVGNAKG